MKKKVIIIIFIILTLYITNMNTANFATKANTIIVPDEYDTIQEAINAANPGNTVYVKPRTYYENITINKTINLIGENPATTIIDGDPYGIRITIDADNVRVQGFTVRNGEAGIFLEKTSRHKIINNIVTLNNEGIYLQYSHNSTVYRNLVVKNILSGICLWESTNNTVIGNQVIDGKGFGIDFWTEYGANKIIGNTIKNNQWNGIYMSYSNNNTIFRNNIINNTVSTYKSYNNTWDNGAEGNFWSSSYTGEDNDGDGIGDTPYTIYPNNTDYHPLKHNYALGDINHDGFVNATDVNLLKESFSTRTGEPQWDIRTDLDYDGFTNAKDAVILAINYKKSNS
jgi:parallel beta-helix repeat protein